MNTQHFYILLVIVGFVVLVVLWNRLLGWLCLKLSDWPKVVARYPSQAFTRPSEIYKGQMGVVGKISMRRGFTIELSEEGLKITPRFTRQLPLFVPWSRLVSVEMVPFSILLSLGSGGPSFYLPRVALETIRSKVRAETLRGEAAGVHARRP